MLVEVKRINRSEMTVVSSLDIASTFEKEHKHVLEDIRRMLDNLSTAEFSALFYESEYKSTYGRTSIQI